MFNRTELNRLFRYASSLCEQESDAFDLLQTGVERCLKSPADDTPRSVNYAIRVIRNEFIDQARRKQRYKNEEFDEDVHAVDYDISSLEQIVVEETQLERIWELLSQVEREILFLWAVEGYSTAEIGELIEKPKNSVLSIIYRMRKRLAAEEGLAAGDSRGVAK